MVARSRLASSRLPILVNDQIGTASPRKSADIVTFPKTKLPALVEDFGKAAARLIWATFDGRSQYAVCLAAAQALGTSPDTIERLLNGVTKAPDARMMFACLAIYQSRHGKPFDIGGGFAIHITQGGK